MKFLQTMDNCSRDIIQDGKHIGYLQWHPDRSPHVTLTKSFTHLSIAEMQECISRKQKHDNSSCQSIASTETSRRKL